MSEDSKPELTKEQRMSKVTAKMKQMVDKLNEAGAPEMSNEELSKRVKEIVKAFDENR